MDDFESKAQPWKDYVNDFNTVIVSEGITSIGNYAFYNYSSVTRIDLPDTIQRIGARAITNCNITTINLTNSLTTIE